MKFAKFLDPDGSLSPVARWLGWMATDTGAQLVMTNGTVAVDGRVVTLTMHHCGEPLQVRWSASTDADLDVLTDGRVLTSIQHLAHLGVADPRVLPTLLAGMLANAAAVEELLDVPEGAERAVSMNVQPTKLDGWLLGRHGRRGGWYLHAPLNAGIHAVLEEDGEHADGRRRLVIGTPWRTLMTIHDVRRPLGWPAVERTGRRVLSDLEASVRAGGEETVPKPSVEPDVDRDDDEGVLVSFDVDELTVSVADGHHQLAWLYSTREITTLQVDDGRLVHTGPAPLDMVAAMLSHASARAALLDGTFWQTGLQCTRWCTEPGADEAAALDDALARLGRALRRTLAKRRSMDMPALGAPAGHELDVHGVLYVAHRDQLGGHVHVEVDGRELDPAETWAVLENWGLTIDDEVVVTNGPLRAFVVVGDQLQRFALTVGVANDDEATQVHVVALHNLHIPAYRGLNGRVWVGTGEGGADDEC